MTKTRITTDEWLAALGEAEKGDPDSVTRSEFAAKHGMTVDAAKRILEREVAAGRAIKTKKFVAGRGLKTSYKPKG